MQISDSSFRPRVLRVLDEIEITCGRRRGSELLHLGTDVLDHQHDDGSWGSNDDPLMKPCFTAQTIDAFLRMGVHYSWEASGPERSPYPSRALHDGIGWLLSVQRQSGSWGEDFWDTCEVVSALIRAGISPDSDEIKLALEYCRSEVETGWGDSAASQWIGPGFLGGALEAFSLARDRDYSRELSTMLLDMQDPETDLFHPPEDRNVPAEWHTACALIGLNSMGSMPPRPARVARALGALKGLQSDEGCWAPGMGLMTLYCTRQATMAVAGADGRHAAEARAGTEWFLRGWRDPELSRPSLSLTLMGNSCVARTHGDELHGSLSYLMLKEVENLLVLLLDSHEIMLERSSDHSATTELLQARTKEHETLAQSVRFLEHNAIASSTQLDQVRDERNRLGQRLDEARQRIRSLERRDEGIAVRLTGAQLAVISVVLGAIGILLAILG